MKNRKKFIIFLGLPIIFAVIITGLYLQMRHQKNALSNKHFVIGRYADAISLDPSIATDSESFQVTVNLFETLVRLDLDGSEVLPGLAKSWSSSEDGLTWNFKIREDVTFHDGSPLTAESIAFNFQRWMYEDNPYHTGQFTYWNQSFGGFPGIVKSVNALSEYTLEITLNEPYAPFLSVLSLPPFGIASPDAIKKFNESHKFHPVGTGPFVFVEWKSGEFITLKKNTHYWNKEPALSTLTFQVIDSDMNLADLFSQGKIHLIEGVPWEQKANLESNEKVLLRYKPLTNIAYLAVNHSVEPFDDIRVRQAIALLIDRNEIITEALTALSKPANSFLPAQSKSYHEGITPPKRNVTQAKTLLREANLEEGFETTLWVSDTSRDYLTNPLATAEVLKKQLEPAGIRLNIQVLPWKTFLERIKNGEHPMLLSGWNGDLTDPDNFLYTLFHSDNTKPSIALNYFFYKNSTLDALLEQARHTLNENFRTSLYRDAQELIYNESVGFPLIHTMSLCAIDYRVLYYKPTAVGHQWFYDIDLR